MSKKDSITLTRIGTIAFTTVGDSHCGIAPAGQKQAADYEVRIKCAPLLDRRHYLVEQLDIDAYMQGILVVEQSCEKLVIDVAYDLLDLCRERNSRMKIKWLQVMIKAAPHKAWMTFRVHP